MQRNITIKRPHPRIIGIIVRNKDTGNFRLEHQVGKQAWLRYVQFFQVEKYDLHASNDSVLLVDVWGWHKCIMEQRRRNLGASSGKLNNKQTKRSNHERNCPLWSTVIAFQWPWLPPTRWVASSVTEGNNGCSNPFHLFSLSMLIYINQSTNQ